MALYNVDQLPQSLQDRITPEPNSGCWLWLGALNVYGYGQWKPPGNRMLRPVHRVIYQKLVGDIPEGLVLDHLCRVRLCCNPAHVEPVTVGENISRGVHRCHAGDPLPAWS